MLVQETSLTSPGDCRHCKCPSCGERISGYEYSKPPRPPINATYLHGRPPRRRSEDTIASMRSVRSKETARTHETAKTSKEIQPNTQDSPPKSSSKWLLKDNWRPRWWKPKEAPAATTETDPEKTPSRVKPEKAPLKLDEAKPEKSSSRPKPEKAFLELDEAKPEKTSPRPIPKKAPSKPEEAMNSLGMTSALQEDH